MYVEPIIARDTINTMTLETIKAYRDHGTPEVRIEDQAAQAHWVLELLGDLGIDLNAVTQELEDKGVDRFARDYEKLLGAIESKRTAVLEGHPFQRRAA
jgi:transaldolase/transaldolase/glucose-6-phosphate isomerase